MPTYCSAFNCYEKHVKGGPITFHSFPAEEQRRKVWEIKLRRANFTASKHSKLCSKHFTPDSFDTTKFGGTWLKKSAIPTLFNFPPDMCIKSDPNAEKLLKEFFEKRAERPSGIEYAATKRKHYIGDFTDEDMDFPEEARKLLHLAKRHAEISLQKKRNLQRINCKLEKKICALQEKLEIAEKQLRLKTATHVLRVCPVQEKLEIMKEISNSGNIN